jgi:hypothetical protein
MESIVRKVRDINEHELHVLEQVVGRKLKENQQIIIQVVSVGNGPQKEAGGEEPVVSDELPEWCNVYDGLTAAEVDELDAAIRERANLTRSS